MTNSSIDRTIKKVEVFNLFGYYNYCIDRSRNEAIKNSLLIIYGDNGSGKTTLLKMIFYLLSPIDKSGHKTKLSQIKFNKLVVTLNDNTIISAIRKGHEITGAYTLGIVQNDESFGVRLELDDTGAIRVSKDPALEVQYLRFLKRISDLNIAINFLSDDRKILSFSEKQEIAKGKKRTVKVNVIGEFESIVEHDDEDSLDVSIKKLENWIRNNVLKASKAGDENTNSVYTKLIRQLSTPKVNNVNAKQVDILLEKINKIRTESLNYYESGLISGIEIEEFEDALKHATESNIVLIYNIIEPYIEGIQGRLNSLSDVQTIVSKFLDSINNYFSNKTIIYNIDIGFVLTHNLLQEKIDLHTLSSGERQLLQLFSNVITSSDESTIFIIDEPEISLNVKWQRKLINTLLGFAAKKKVQFIFASHSIELLSGHSNSVYKLENL